MAALAGRASPRTIPRVVRHLVADLMHAYESEIFNPPVTKS
jgi:hypothetical protein